MEIIIPLISVVMPVYNGEKYLLDAIESILTQTFTDFEFIIIDDGSTDHSLEIIESYAKRDQRIKIVINKGNLGLAKSLNIGIGISRGEYIARMDADDISLPGRFTAQVQFLQANPSMDVVGSWAEVIDENGHPVGIAMRYPASSLACCWNAFFNPPVAHPAVMLRRTVFADGDLYDGSRVAIEDYELWSRLNLKFRFSNLQKTLLQYRRHASSTSRSNFAFQSRSSLDISRRAVSSYLGKDVPLDVIRLVKAPYRSITAATYRASISVLWQLYHKFHAENSLAPPDLVYINFDVANRLSQISHNNRHIFSSRLLRFFAINLVFWTFIYDILKNNRHELKKKLAAVLGSGPRTPGRVIGYR
jgi:glycosyltransferase involved in cell wall biosynthesis